MGAALIMFPRSDIAREFRATAHKALGEWIDELEESFESNPAPNVMDFSEIFQQSRAKILALTMKASAERLFPSFLEQKWVQSPGVIGNCGASSLNPSKHPLSRESLFSSDPAFS